MAGLKTKLVVYGAVVATILIKISAEEQGWSGIQNGTLDIEPPPSNQELSAAEAIPLGIEPFIIGGSQAVAGQFPWQAAVQGEFNGKSTFCGGSLISKQWILTAAHCVEGPSFLDSIGCIFGNLLNFDQWEKCWRRIFTVALGSISLKGEDKKRVIFTTTEVIRNPNYRGSDLSNDIALIKLPQSVNLTDYIKIISLASDRLGVGVSVVVSGWGKTSDESSVVSHTLNFVSLETISNSDCTKYYTGNVVKDQVFCARGANNQSSCNGDSGGPAVIYTESKVGLVGVVSFVSSKGCESGYPSGYTRTESFNAWINSVIET